MKIFGYDRKSHAAFVERQTEAAVAAYLRRDPDFSLVQQANVSAIRAITPWFYSY